MNIEQLNNDKKELQQNILTLLNDFESVYGCDLNLGRMLRYNGSNNASGKIIDIGLTASF